MNAKIKRLWVKALRSGKYRQARGALRKNTGAMCCLGVLCEIQGINWRKTADMLPLGTTDVPRAFNAGLRREQRTKLGIMNDGTKTIKRHSFREIADYIAKNL